MDPEDRLLWRQRGRRLEAEAIRDGMLAGAGTLDQTLYGEPVGMETKAGGEIVAAGEEQGGRRSLYLLVRRTQPVHLLNVFDAPVMETNCTRRATSTTATQALALINGTFMAAQSRHFARRVLKERPAAGADAGAVDYAYTLAFARPPTAAERQTTLQFLEEQIARYRKDPPRAATAVEEAYGDFAQALLSANEFIYVD